MTVLANPNVCDETQSMKRITILLAEDHKVIREGVRMILELDADLEIVGEAQTGRYAVALAKKLRPAVVLMDIAMPQLNGLEATRQILTVLPNTRILILSAHNDEAYLKNAMESGAVGFLLKQSTAHDLGQAIREVNRGHVFFGPFISKLYLEGERKSWDRARRSKLSNSGLTSREMEVLQLIAEGKANKQTAAELGIGTKTVEKHRDHLMQKLGIHDTAGLTRYAISVGIIESSVQLTVIQ